MSERRYSESQVLYGLREAWSDFTGGDQTFEASTQIDSYMKADGTWDEIDFVDVFRGIEQFFGFECTDSEWTEFFGFDAAKRSLDEGASFGSAIQLFGLQRKLLGATALVASLVVLLYVLITPISVP